MHRCERRHCRRDYVLRTQFSANTYRVPDAMGICMVPMDPVAGMVGLRLVDCLSAHWRRRTKGGDQFRLIGCASRRRSSGHRYLADLEKAEAARRTFTGLSFREFGCHP